MIFIIILLIILILILIISFITFKITFGRSKTMDLPERQCYIKYKNNIIEASNKFKKIPFEEIYINSFDNTKLYGRLYKYNDSKEFDICFHGYKGEAFRDFSGSFETMSLTKHNMLLIDERAHGKSKGRVITFGIKERKDGLCWINYLIENFGNDIKIYLYGMSMGAATVLMMNDLELPENVKFIIADSAYSSPKEIIKKTIKDMKLPSNLVYLFIYLGSRIYGNFNIDESSALEAVKKKKIPILLIHGTDDLFVPHEMSEEIFKNISGRKEILLMPEADHGMSYMVDKDKYYEVMLNFIKEKNI